MANMPSKRRVSPYMHTGDVNYMGLGDYLHALGDPDGYQMTRATGVPRAIIKNVSNGHPIAEVHAKKIAAWLSQQYQRDIRVDDIANLFIISPGRKLPVASASDAGSDVQSSSSMVQ